ncbi:T9SS type A sorting domain-containing protein [Polluticaenibacter yanchengensis]|uniref:T9SS type A sorting domain-containing protein n=1 Tax=Polluticaenibacter yanchengensis TaxID=3014562 RepID=A0ABT4UPN1_9BACT|nr:T9SS type A sorting domain-containing protein [Chitinophagaceae bacterium LY-5]
MQFFALLLFCMVIKAQNITRIYTDFNGYYTSGVGFVDTASKRPNKSHHLLAFTYTRDNVTKTFSTGVNDNILVNNGVSFTPSSFKALPINRISGTPGTNTYIGVGTYYNNVNNLTTNVTLTNNLDYYLTDGTNGLNLGTAIYNLPVSTIDFQVDNFNISRINDGVADIVVTQMGAYDTPDEFRFVDVNGNTVGYKLTVNMGAVNSVGVANWVFYNPTTKTRSASQPTSGTLGSGENNGRDMRLRCWDLADFGLNETNVGNIVRFEHILGGSSDMAFVAYNTSSFRALTDIQPGCITASNTFWLQSTRGLTLSSGNVTTWKDNSVKGLNVTQNTAGLYPAYSDNNLTNSNYNSQVIFSPNQKLVHPNTPFTTDTENMEVFVVARSHNSSSQPIVAFEKSSSASPTNNFFPSLNLTADNRLTFVYNSTSPLVTSNAAGASEFGLFNINYTRGGNLNIALNGVTSQTLANQTLSLGTWNTTMGAANSNFRIAEIITYPSVLSNADKLKIQSYLAIKYGKTLPQNYYSGGGSVIWNSTGGYHNRVFGIGRDDCQSLMQKQSRPTIDTEPVVEIAMTSFTASNSTNLTAMADGQFLIFGDNNGSLTSNAIKQSTASCFNTPLRTWQVQRTGNVINTQAAQVKLNLSNITWNNSSLVNSASNLYLLIDRNSNGVYNDAVDVAIKATSFSSNIAVFDNVVFDTDGNGSDLFTVGIVNGPLPSPGAISGNNSLCVNTGTYQFTNSVTGGVWSLDSAYIGTINNSGLLTVNNAGLNTVRYTVTNTVGCYASTTYNIHAYTNPANPGVSATYRFCSNENVTYNSLLTSETNTNWYATSNGTTPINGNQPAQTGTVYAKAIRNGCYSNAVASNITIDPFYSAGDDITATSSTVTLNADPSTGNWTVLSVSPFNGYINIAEPNKYNSTVTLGWRVSAMLQWNPANSVCKDVMEILNVQVLSVTGLEFNANWNSNYPLLSWSTLTEENNTGFDIYRSYNGSDYSKIGFVTSKNEKPFTYQLTDSSIGTTSKKVFYKVAAVDKNGSLTYSKTIQLSQNVQNQPLVTPNPFSNYLQLSNLPLAATVSVYNASGALVLSQKVTGSARISTNNLVAGAYIVIIRDNQTTFNFKLIKQ